MDTGAERTMVIDGVQHRWLERGEGPAVVLLHGIPTSPELWRHVAPLVDGARLLAWEMPGYGRSAGQGVGRDISVKAQARYLRLWLMNIGCARAVLVGHDLGGGVAQIAAVQEPSICAGLVLTNCIAYDSWPIPSVKAMRAVGAVVRRTPPPVFRRVLAGFIRQGHDDPDRARESAVAHWPGYDHTDGATAFVRQVRSLRTADTLEVAAQLPSLRVPTALVWGAADRFQKLAYGQRLARDLKGHLETVSTGKHFMPEDHPHELVAAIARVLEQAW